MCYLFFIMNTINSNKALVLKVGTDVITTTEGLPDIDSMRHLVQQLLKIREHYPQTVLVSSGSVAFGKHARGIHKLDRKNTRAMQLCASVGQRLLMDTYQDLLQEHGSDANVAQLLVTKGDFLSVPHNRNIRGMLRECFTATDDNVVIVNENDSVATQALLFTDNDQLAGMTARQIQATRLVLVSCVPGVLTDLSNKKSVLPLVKYGDKSWRTYVQPGAQSTNGRGGMFTKCTVAQNVAQKRVQTHILNGRVENALIRCVLENEPLGTTFLPRE